jgi:hypothetical protein
MGLPNWSFTPELAYGVNWTMTFSGAIWVPAASTRRAF